MPDPTPAALSLWAAVGTVDRIRHSALWTAVSLRNRLCSRFIGNMVFEPIPIRGMCGLHAPRFCHPRVAVAEKGLGTPFRPRAYRDAMFVLEGHQITVPVDPPVYNPRLLFRGWARREHTLMLVYSEQSIAKWASVCGKPQSMARGGDHQPAQKKSRWASAVGVRLPFDVPRALLRSFPALRRFVPLAPEEVP